MSIHGANCHLIYALTTHERPKGTVDYYIVECTCGWESKMTTDWRKSLDDHARRVPS